MILIAGLGNPGKKYEGTRHNSGYGALDVIAKRNHIVFSEEKHKGLYGKGMIGSEKVVLVKPLTFMNLSGECIRELCDYYKIDTGRDFIVLYDDISLPPGMLRVRSKGSAGGHNGIKNIILHLGHEEFSRVRIGIGEKPAGYDLADYVLGHFDKEDRALMDEAFERAADAVECILENGVETAMNRFNKKV